MMNYDMSRLEEALVNKKFTKEMYESNDYWLLKTAYVLFVSLQEYTEYAEEHSKIYIPDQSKWLSFLQLYYARMNTITNVFEDYFEGNSISKEDKDKLMESISWVLRITQGTFPLSKKETPPYVFDAIVAGIYYNSVFYYSKKLEKMILDSFDMKEEKFEALEILDMIDEENNYLKEIQTFALKNERQVEQIPREMQENLFFMWHRTINLVNTDLDNEFVKLSKVFA